MLADLHVQLHLFTLSSILWERGEMFLITAPKLPLYRWERISLISYQFSLRRQYSLVMSTCFCRLSTTSRHMDKSCRTIRLKWTYCTQNADYALSPQHSGRCRRLKINLKFNHRVLSNHSALNENWIIADLWMTQTLNAKHYTLRANWAQKESYAGALKERAQLGVIHMKSLRT